MNKLKNIDWKQLGIDHGEKIGIAIVALLGIYALIGTSWKREGRTKDELVRKADMKRLAINDNEYPQDKESGKLHGSWEFEDITNIEDRANRMVAAVGFQRYEFSTPVTWPIVPPRKKRLGLKRVSPFDTRAVFVSDAIAMNHSEEEAKDAEDEKDGEDNKDDRFRFSDGGGSGVKGKTGGGTGLGGGDNGNFGGGGLGGPGGGGLGGGDGGYSSGGAAGGSDFGGGAGDDNGGYGNTNGGLGTGGLGGSGLGGGEGQAERKSNFESEGHRTVVVTSVVDIFEQRRLMAESLQVPLSDPLVQASLSYVDFKVERRFALNGTEGEWSDWAEVDVEVANDILVRCFDLGKDPVKDAVKDDVLTMPLPMRMVQEWGKEASHPRIEKFTMSPSQQKRKELADELAREQYKKFLEKKKKKDTKSQGKQRRKWSVGSDDIDGMKAEMKADPKSFEEFVEQLKKQNLSAELADQSAEGNLLLFRYLDFSVEPGKTYQYHVQLELENPNYGLPADELREMSVGDKQTLSTEWSKASPAVAIPYDHEYFVNEVNADTEIAEVNMFYWYYKTGTRVSADAAVNKGRGGGLKIGVGDFVGGIKNTYVLRMDKETLNREKIRFESRDFLLGISAPVLDTEVLADLALEIKDLDKDTKKNFGARLTVARPDGDFVTITTGTAGKNLDDNRQFMQAMHKFYEGREWKDREGGSGKRLASRRKRGRGSNSDGGGYDGDYGGGPGGGGLGGGGLGGGGLGGGPGGGGN